MPDEVIQAFRSPLEIQPKHAEAIAAGLEHNRAAIMQRAERLRLGEKQLTAAQTVQALVPHKVEGVEKAAIQFAGRDIGSYSMTAQGRLVISLNHISVERESVSVIITALTDAIAATASRSSANRPQVVGAVRLRRHRRPAGSQLAAAAHAHTSCAMGASPRPVVAGPTGGEHV